MLPRMHRRSISVDGESYYWHFTTGREFDHRDPQLVIQSAQGGQLLVVKQKAWPDVTPAYVKDVIARAIVSGWQSQGGTGQFEMNCSGQSESMKHD